jgi:preprotein translocase subunit SecA
MLNWFVKKLIGSKNERQVRRLMRQVAEINSIEESLQNLPDEALREKTEAWKERFALFHDPHFITVHRSEDPQVLGEFFQSFTSQCKELAALGLPTPDCMAAIQSAIEEDAEAMERAVRTLRTGNPARPVIDSGLPDEAKLRILRAAIRTLRDRWFEEVAPKIPQIEAKILEEILPEAFAVVKNGARRLCGTQSMVSDHPQSWDMVHFDVQLVGGMVLHRHQIAEMATGEGKTLVATLAAYLNALTGKGVHIVTVNDYLARRDAEWMGYLYSFLGLTVGCLQNDQRPAARREEYRKDITYGTNSEFGFDYLRDNGMAARPEHQVQRGHFYAIIDEVDSVLIDEARTPLIISGPVASGSIDQQFDRYKPTIAQLVRKQNALCSQLVSEAKKLVEEGQTSLAGRKLYQVKSGNPRNRQFMRCMEEPELRRLVEKAELELYQDPQKSELFSLKEELFYAIDEKTNDADLTEQGRSFLNPDDPDAFVLPDIATVYAEIDADPTLSANERESRRNKVAQELDTQGQRIHAIAQLLRAFCVYEKDVHYVVEENKVVIVDVSTGRKMPGRRWSDGLHQAVEAKEGVKMEGETQTYATITIQNYFRLYQKLAGMTGTAETDAAEFADIYGLSVIPIPTNAPVQRIDQNDTIYKTQRQKYNAVLDMVRNRHAKGQPILLGTASVAASELLSRMLKRDKIPHAVLNAKYHRQEAEIIARAGHKGAVTVATNMAGRGTDIKLGEGAKDLGGLCVIGTERHESRRIDRQLRGRCARQGDPGESKFFISFEDDLMRNFGSAERMTKMMERFGMKDDEELEHPLLNRSVQTAQKRVEQRNYVSRKHVLEYDDVMNQQREVIYNLRGEVVESLEPRELLFEFISKALPGAIAHHIDPETAAVDHEALRHWVRMNLPIRLGTTPDADPFEGMDERMIANFLFDRIKEAYELRVKGYDPLMVDDLERTILLGAIDQLWQEHLYAMDSLKEGIRLRSYGQKDPLVEYKQEAYLIFEELMDNIQQQVLSNVFRSAERLHAIQQAIANMRTAQSREQQLPEQQSPDNQPVAAGRPDSAPQGGGPQKEFKLRMPAARELPKVGRNEPCPCGSGKKYKQCCGKL